MRTRLFAPLLSLLLLPAVAHAELKPLRESPSATVALDVGLTNIRVDYHRPGVKGRAIWGALVPYGAVWRAGANEATTVTFSDAVKIDGKDIPAGTYAFFAIPDKDKWTLILNKQAKAWGAYTYDAKDDLLRVTVTPQTAPSTEWLVYELLPVGDHGARLELAWEKLKVGLQIEVDVHGRYKAAVLDAIAKLQPNDPQALMTYLVAAQYWNKQNLDANQALGWVDQALKIKESPSGYELKADTLHRLGRDAEAIALVDKAMTIAKGKAPAEYLATLQKKRDGYAKAPAKKK